MKQISGCGARLNSLLSVLGAGADVKWRTHERKTRKREKKENFSLIFWPKRYTYLVNPHRDFFSFSCFYFLADPRNVLFSESVFTLSLITVRPANLGFVRKFKFWEPIQTRFYHVTGCPHHSSKWNLDNRCCGILYARQFFLYLTLFHSSEDRDVYNDQKVRQTADETGEGLYPFHICLLHAWPVDSEIIWVKMPDVNV